MRAHADANTATLAELGHWGVPVFAFVGAVLWGRIASRIWSWRSPTTD